MENFSVEKNEQEIEFQDSIQESIQEPLQNSISGGVEDIQFEEVLDIDEIQKKLQGKIYENDPEIESSQDVDAVINENTSIAKNKTSKLPVKADSNAKKYVIYVNQDNIDFMENLSINERKEIINKILKEQNEVARKRKEINARKKYIKHLILAIFTFIIGFPIMFVIVNKAMESTLNNVQESKQNMMKLYKDNGKIKMGEPTSVKNIKY